MKIKNYKYYDNLTLYVKKNKLKEIIQHYEIFGWELVEQKENGRYEDIVDLTFTRPHKIKHKDELQLQQVYMEEKLNELGKCERYKHSKTTSFGLCFGLITIAIIVLGVLISLSVKSIEGLICGIVIVVMGFLLIGFEFVMLRKIYQYENELYEQRSEELERQIVKISKRVTELTGGEYEQDCFK